LKRTLIIANPMNDISSAKFLGKFCRIVENFYDNIIIISDFNLNNIVFANKVTNIGSTKYLSRIKGRDGFSKLFRFLLGNILISTCVLRKHRQVNDVYIFPILFSLPVIIARLLGKRVILYEAQDILNEGLRLNKYSIDWAIFYLMMASRNITLQLSNKIIVEGIKVVEINKIQKYSNKVFECPQYVDMNKYSIVNPYHDREFSLGFVGTLSERKHALDFLEIAILYVKNNKNNKVIIIGDGPLRKEISERIKAQKLSNNIIMKSNVPEQEMPGIMNRIKMMIMISEAEGLPNVILESMACGVLVITTPVGAIRDVISDGYNGFLIEIKSIQSIVEQISNIERRSDIQQIIENARELLISKYSMDSASQRYENMLRLD
jgi:glycosyltransferase involved in cell wall biosynthesis